MAGVTRFETASIISIFNFGIIGFGLVCVPVSGAFIFPFPLILVVSAFTGSYCKENW